MATHEEALTAKKALNAEAFNGRVLTVKWCAVGLCQSTVRSCLLLFAGHVLLVSVDRKGVLGSRLCYLAYADYQELLASAESLLWLPAGRSSSACSGLAIWEPALPTRCAACGGGCMTCGLLFCVVACTPLYCFPMDLAGLSAFQPEGQTLYCTSLD